MKYTTFFLLILLLLTHLSTANLQTPETCTILWTGDTLLGDAAQQQLDEQGYLWPFEYIQPLLVADYAITNSEVPITTSTTAFDPDQTWSYNAQPESAEALAAMGFDALGLANNHAKDRGAEGIVATINYAKAFGMTTFGAGRDETEAATPLIIETPCGIIGVVGVGPDRGAEKLATETQAGWVLHTPENIERGYQLAREAGADWVIGYVHWGANYAPMPGQEERDLAQVFHQVGYDLVIGHGPHIVQSLEWIEGMPVFYSIGNFVFTTPGRFKPEAPGYGLIVITEFAADGWQQVRLHCIQTDNDVVQFQPRPCTREQSIALFQSMSADIAVEDGTGIVQR